MHARGTDHSLDAGALLEVLLAFRRGDFSVRMPSDHSGLAGQIANALNDIVGLGERMTQEFQRVGVVAQALRESEELLRRQQEDLQRANEELEQRAQLLTQEKHEVERARGLVEEKAEQLAQTSRYKSQFLANMSHELRTPLNSMLILSKVLWDNVDGNLSAKQADYAQIVHSSGIDLLTLIDDVLDLCKIEAGTMQVDLDEVNLSAIAEYCDRTLGPVAEQRRIEFAIHVDPDLPERIQTDGRRLQQVLKNLLSNAFKFTDEGGVSLTIHRAERGWSEHEYALDGADMVVAFVVEDTGIGIPHEKHRMIFEAFQQADGTTSRRYGGTGLGLSISREIARMLGGEVCLESEPGRGSAFTLFLPARPPSRRRRPSAGESMLDRPRLTAPPESRAANDPALVAARELPPPAHVLLTLSDDGNLVSSADAIARQHGFETVHARVMDGTMRSIVESSVAAVLLDGRGDSRGAWTLLDRLEHDLRTRHIPVGLVTEQGGTVPTLPSGAVVCTSRSPDPGALAEVIAELSAFVQRRTRTLLLLTGDDQRLAMISELLGAPDLRMVATAEADAALARMRDERVDALVFDAPGANGAVESAFARVIADVPHTTPVVLYQAPAALAVPGRGRVLRAATPSELLDVTTRVMHRAVGSLPPATLRLLENMRHEDDRLRGFRVLVIDDDARNIFALETLLERHGLEVLRADNGRDGIEVLRSVPGIQAVLVDMMMPEMDGYETMRAIRQIEGLAELPIIAVTAQAMMGDREKCLEGGASDYIAKPIDTDQLLALLRVWLRR